jgi:hypothetical protein
MESNTDIGIKILLLECDKSDHFIWEIFKM